VSFDFILNKGMTTGGKWRAFCLDFSRSSTRDLRTKNSCWGGEKQGNNNGDKTCRFSLARAGTLAVNRVLPLKS
jgi:hypothetical protein